MGIQSELKTDASKIVPENKTDRHKKKVNSAPTPHQQHKQVMLFIKALLISLTVLPRMIERTAKMTPSHCRKAKEQARATP